MKYYQRPTENFFILPNNIFDLRLEPIQFAIYSYLVSCAGSKLSCFPRQETIADKTGIGISSAQKHLKILEQRKLIEVSKHIKPYGYHAQPPPDVHQGCRQHRREILSGRCNRLSKR